MTSRRRRDLLTGSSAALGAALLGSPLPLSASQGTGRAAARRLKLLVAGAHPDDPESIAGGTILRYVDAGHEVVCLYLTRGEAGIAGKTHAEAAAVRTDEVLRACSLLKARARLVGQVDGATEIGVGRYAETRRIFDEERPDLVITHWPIDTHRDHRAMALLAYDAWLDGRRFELYFAEAMTGAQTQAFAPSHYVDITAVEPRKRAACFAHASPNPAEFYAHHETMHRFRGREAGCELAEAFARQPSPASGAFPA
jgi:LmbE family N-acetylglucosaminyl deacetylase